MVIGIISDTHDNIRNILKAKDIFLKKNVQLVIHCGDISSTSTIKEFEGLDVRFVKGNCDYDEKTRTIAAKKINCEFMGNVGELTIDEKHIGIIHGNDEHRLQKMIDSQKFNYIFTGHTHQKNNQKIGKTRIVNPGAHKNGENTIAIVDLQKDIVDFIKIS